MAVSTIKRKTNVGALTGFTFSNSWTAPSDGILVLKAQRTSGSAGNVTFYLRDATDVITVMTINVTNLSGGFWASGVVPVIAGHQYVQDYSSGIQLVSGLFYPLN